LSISEGGHAFRSLFRVFASANDASLDRSSGLRKHFNSARHAG
jgi:hypothetical protein